MLTKPAIRTLIAVSVAWLLIIASIIFFEYLSHDPEFRNWNKGIPPELFFWKWSDVATADLLAPRTFAPNLLRIVGVLFGPIPLFWLAGWLIMWVKDGFRR